MRHQKDVIDAFIVNFEQISRIILVFPLLTCNMLMPSRFLWNTSKKFLVKNIIFDTYFCDI